MAFSYQSALFYDPPITRVLTNLKRVINGATAVYAEVGAEEGLTANEFLAIGNDSIHVGEIKSEKDIKFLTIKGSYVASAQPSWGKKSLEIQFILSPGTAKSPFLQFQRSDLYNLCVERVITKLFNVHPAELTQELLDGWPANLNTDQRLRLYREIGFEVTSDLESFPGNDSERAATGYAAGLRFRLEMTCGRR